MSLEDDWNRERDRRLVAEHERDEWKRKADAQAMAAYRARTERDALAARLAAVEALAAHYEAEARSEGYGGELWSTTGAAIRAALATAENPYRTEADGD